MLGKPVQGKEKRVVQCSLTSLTKAQLNYSIVELKHLGIQWGLSKVDYFARGAKEVTVHTDHAPLVGLEKEDMAQIKKCQDCAPPGQKDSI